MLIAYFDSNVYVKLAKLGGRDCAEFKVITALLNGGKVRIFLSDSNLVELAAGFSKDPESTRLDFQVTREICMRRPTRTVQDLIQREVRRLRDYSVTLTVDESRKSPNHEAFLLLWDNYVAGDDQFRVSGLAAERQQEMKNIYVQRQRRAHEDARRALTIEGRLPQGRIPCAWIWADKEVREMLLKPSLTSYIAEVPLETTPDELWAGLDNCPGLSRQFRYYIQLFVNEVCRGRGAHESDAYDLKHVTFSAYADVFVSEDEFLRKGMVAAGCSPDKVLSLEEFIESTRDSDQGLEQASP